MLPSIRSQPSSSAREVLRSAHPASSEASSLEPIAITSLAVLLTLPLLPSRREQGAPDTPSELSSPAALPAAPQRAARADEDPRRWSLTAFAGQYDDSRFLEILRLQGGDLEPSYIAGLALNHRFAEWPRDLWWELEGSAYTHWGLQDLFELNAAVVTRWTRFPWDDHVDTSVAFGQGISWASELPPLEDETRQLLHHLLAEVEFSPPRQSPLSLVLRVHHRSGVFGLYGASGGANWLTLGLRYRF